MKYLFGLLISLSISLACNAQSFINESPEFVQKISQSNTENTIIFDVRTEQEWQEGIIANSKLIDFYSDDFINQVKKIIQTDTKQVVFVCRSGGRSSNAAMKVKELFPQLEVINMEGGMIAWSKQKLPIVSYK